MNTIPKSYDAALTSIISRPTRKIKGEYIEIITGGVISLPSGSEYVWLNGVLKMERDAGVPAGVKFLMSPDFSIDPRLACWIKGLLSRNLRIGTINEYVKAVRLWVNHLHQRGINWMDATADDVIDYSLLRTAPNDGSRPISQNTWTAQSTGISSLYDCALIYGWVSMNPMLARRSRGQRNIGFRNLDSTQDVRWLSPKTYELFRDVGIRRYQLFKNTAGFYSAQWGVRDGNPDLRTNERDALFADMLFNTGMRRNEAGSLVLTDIPVNMTDSSVIYIKLGRAVTKNGIPRAVEIGNHVVKRMDDYIQMDRKYLVENAQSKGTYEKMKGVIRVTHIGKGLQPKIHFQRPGDSQTTHTCSMGDLSPKERKYLFLQTDNGLEPLQLWLTTDGRPMACESWNMVFRRATSRLHNLGLTTFPNTTPHSLRHSCAIFFLVTAMSIFAGIKNPELVPLYENLRNVLGDPMTMVMNKLGHLGPDVTRKYYAKPADAQIFAQALTDTDVLRREEVFSRIENEHHRLEISESLELKASSGSPFSASRIDESMDFQ